MNTKLSFLVRSSLLAFGALSLGGCHVFFSGPRHHRPAVVHHREPAHVTVVHRSEPDQHYCNDGCDHMWNGSTFVVIVGGHRHGHSCGHELVGRRWVVARVVVNGDGGHDGGGHDGGGRGNDGDGNGNGNGNGGGRGNGNGGGRGNGKPR
jgi:hypothetical protein